MSNAGLDVGGLVLDGSGPVATTVMTALINDLVQLFHDQPDKTSVVILDDYHVIHAAEVHEAVMFLLDHLPARLHLVVATRADPPLPLGRLRVRGSSSSCVLLISASASRKLGAF